MNERSHAVRRFRRRAAALAAASRFPLLSAGWLLAWGTLALVLRVGLGTPEPLLLWGLLGLPAAAALALVHGLGRRPSDLGVEALMDRESAAGGLLMAAREVPLGRWSARVDRVSLPQLRLRRGRQGRRWAVAALAGAYAAACLALPTPRAGAAPRPLDVGSEAAALAEQVRALEEQGLVEPERAEALEKQIEQLEEEASGTDPARTWEALDHLQELAEGTAEQAAEDALAEAERLAVARQVAEGLATAAEAGVDVSAAAQELGELVGEAMAANAAVARSLSPELREALAAGGTLSAEQLRELASQLGASGEQLAQTLADLQAAGLLDPEALRRAESLGEGGQAADQALQQFLEENAAAGGACDGALGQVGLGSKPGNGEVGRGRGDAPMTWSEGTDPEGSRFREVVLPPTTLEALSGSQLLGLDAVAPAPGAADPAPGTAPSGLDATPGAGGSAATQTVLPRHRGAVRRYFEPEKKP